MPKFSSFFSKINLIKHPYFEYPSHLNYFTINSLDFLFKKAGMQVVNLETVTLDWEIEYISRGYNKKDINLTAYELLDKWSEPGNGERCLCLAQKIEEEN